MKRILLNLCLVILVSIIVVPVSVAQERKVERRVKIVKVDEKGERIEIDTVLTGDTKLEDLDLPEGIKIKKGDSFSYYISDEDAKEIFITIDDARRVLKEGDDKDGNKVIAWTISDGDTIKKESYAFTSGTKSYIWVSGDGKGDIHVNKDDVFIKKGDDDHGVGILKSGKDTKGKDVHWEFMSSDDLDEDEKEIIIHSSEGHERLRIKGDAVIKIVDGRVKIEAGEVEKELERKIVKKKNK